MFAFLFAAFDWKSIPLALPFILAGSCFLAIMVIVVVLMVVLVKMSNEKEQAQKDAVKCADEFYDLIYRMGLIGSLGTLEQNREVWRKAQPEFFSTVTRLKIKLRGEDKNLDKDTPLQYAAKRFKEIQDKLPAFRA